MTNQPDPQHLAAELQMVVSRLIKKLRTHSPTAGRLSLTERAVVKQLAQHGSLLPSELAAREKVTTQSMSQILSRLDALGYLTRQPEATDRRKVRIGLTTAGQAIIPAVRREASDWLGRALQATCSAPEQATLAEAVRVLARIVEVD
ncbi:MarR family winged helix-turn-helix transcriptional regulator [Hymenobacter psoromatis]|uniref:MarR family winged helix-turn-helix transcriptional regulator n=1 Tax=Hymenobacter psoromatis TaxID=1484116 RepID=UPI001CC10071|nr:MarR family transcriptional regulator [Hymenobacter psoromatis]